MIKFMKFGLVGVGNTLLTFTVYTLLILMGVNYLVANIIGYTIGVANSYFFNRRWVFNVQSSNKTLLKFVVVNVITLLFNTVCLYLLVHYLDLHALIAQVIATGFGLILNFSLNKIWTFK